MAIHVTAAPKRPAGSAPGSRRRNEGGTARAGKGLLGHVLANDILPAATTGTEARLRAHVSASPSFL